MDILIVHPENQGVWRDHQAYFRPSSLKSDLDSTLRQRGQLVVERGHLSKTLVPIPSKGDPFPARGELFRSQFADRTFRKVLRLLTAARGGVTPISEIERVSGRRAVELVSRLEEMNLVTQLPEGLLLTRSVDNIGPTLECFVADICRRELAGSSEWGVVLEGLPSGGDFDVLAWLPPLLVYIECKSSRPSEIGAEELRAFLQRHQELSPDLTILLVDTDSSVQSIAEKLTDVVTPVLRKLDGQPSAWRPSEPVLKPSQTFRTVFYGWPGISLINTRPSITTQLRRCLQHYHAKVKGTAFFDGRPSHVNFVTGSIDES